jgi:hypothetical protein
MYTVFGGWLGLSIIGEGIAVDTIIKEGISLASLGPAAIFAIGCILSIYALVRLYLNEQKNNEDLKTIIRSTTEAIVKSNDVGERTVETLDKINLNLASCSKKSS